MSSNTQVSSDLSVETDPVAVVDMRLEVVVIPVADVDRAKAFYTGLGWRLDADFPGDDFRVIQITPTGSATSIIFGHNVTKAVPGSTQGLQLVVSDIEAARAEMISRGVQMSELFHDAGGVFHHGGTDARVTGAAPERGSYGTFASFEDPDGNGWLFQEVTTRLPGRVEGETAYGSATDLAEALRRAAAAHGEHEARIGAEDPDWPAWYAAYMVAERAGTALPS